MKYIIKILLLFVLLVLGPKFEAFSQAKKPSIMVVPSDEWCIKNGFIFELDNQGSKLTLPDYRRAVQENTELNQVIAKIEALMIERGFPLKGLEASLKSLMEESAEDATNAGLNENPVDKLKKVAKADIWMQITWDVNVTGPKKSISFTLKGIDAYTSKSVAVGTGTGQPSFSAELPLLLEEAVLAHIDNFNVQLQGHFDDMFANGREVVLRIKTVESFDGDLYSEYNGEELGVLIENWLTANTVGGRFNTVDATENMMLFEQVRIPLYDANGKAIDTRGWCMGLKKYLTTLQINLKLNMKGLGQAIIVIGEK